MHASCSCTHALADDRPAELETPQAHAPHIQPRAARSKQKNILSWSTIVARTEYSVLLLLGVGARGNKKKKKEKKQSCKLPCMRCAVSKPHWPLLTPWELALLCPLAREQNDTATHASSMCMHVSAVLLTPCSIYDDDRRQLVTPLIQYKPHARHVFGLTTAREEAN